MSTNFTLVKRGYNPVEVDNYIKTLEQQLSEYREKSAAINNAIINAQLAADNIIKEAHLKTDKMLSGAENDALVLKQQTLSQLTSLKSNVASQKKLIETFQNDYNELLKKYLAPIDNKEVNPMLTKLNDIEKLIDELSSPKTPMTTEKTPEEKAVSKITADMPAPRQPEIHKAEPINNGLGKENDTTAANPYTKANTAPTAKPNDTHMSNPYAKPNDIHMSNPYAKPNDAPVSNPYAKPNNIHMSNPYAKPNDAPVSNPYAKPNDAPVSNPYAKPNSQPMANPYAKADNTAEPVAQKPSVGGNFAKPTGGLNKPFSPFSKKTEAKPAAPKTESINPFAKPQSTQFNAATSNAEEVSVINENQDYTSFLATHPVDEPTNNYTSKPGIYKATDLYSEFATTLDKDADSSFSNDIIKDELDEFMPTKH